MDVQDVHSAIQRYIMELRVELQGWHESLPIEIVEKWIKRVERHVLKPLEFKED